MGGGGTLGGSEKNSHTSRGRGSSSGFSDGKCQYFPKFKFNIQNKSNFCRIFMEQWQVPYLVFSNFQPSDSSFCFSVTCPWQHSASRLQLWQTRASHNQLYLVKSCHKEILAVWPSKWLSLMLSHAQITTWFERGSQKPPVTQLLRAKGFLGKGCTWSATNPLLWIAPKCV